VSALLYPMRSSCRLNQTPHSGNTRNLPTCLWSTIRSVNQTWASFPSGLPLLQQKSENYNSIQCRLCVKIVFLYWCHTENLSLYWWLLFWQCWFQQWPWKREYTWVLGLMCMGVLFNVLMFLNSHRWFSCAWFIYPILCWCWCLKIATSSINWAQLSRFHMKTETESSLQNVVLLNKNRMMDNVHKRNNCINIPSSQTFIS
jgi:hypothetical protein